MNTPSNTRKGILAVWTDIAPEAESDFITWYDREHLPERAGNEGFLNARRYRALEGEPRTFAAYDTVSLAALGSPAYAHALANQTPWSMRMFPHFRNTQRMIGEQVADHGRGMGGALITLRYRFGTGEADPLRRGAGEGSLAALCEREGIVRVTAVLGAWSAIGNDPAATVQQVAEAPDAGLVIVESSESGRLEAVRAALLEGGQPLLPKEAGTPEVGLYALQCAVTRGEVTE